MASGSIKGITVEIGGDTSKLGKAIENSEKQSRSLQTELRQIEKLLKFDPSNVELLSQKQKVLTQNIEETGNKLDVLKEAEKQVIAQFERGEVAEEQVRALQREIIKTEGVLGSMKDELSSTNKALQDVADGTNTAEKNTKEYTDSLEKAQEELSNFKEQAGETFNTIATGATVLAGAVTATAGYALNLSTEFDKAFNTLITKTGASTEEMESLNEAMEAVYANNFGESIEDVAVSMATVRNNTKLSADELQLATERALLLRDTFEFEVNESTRSAKMLMDQYGISAEEAFNLIAQGAQNGLDKNGDLLDTINEYAVHFKQLGIDAPTMFNMLVNGAESGTFSVDKLGDSIKEFGIRVKDGSKTTVEGFDAIGLNADEMAQKFAQGGESAKNALNETVTALFSLEDPIAQNTAGVNLFGTMWEDLGVDGMKALMNLEGEISNSKDALSTINDVKYDDIGSSISELKRTLETDIIDPLGDELKPVVEDVIETVKSNAPQIKAVLTNVVDKVGEFVTFVVDNGPTILSVIAGVGTAFVAWKVGSMIAGLIGVITSFIGVLKTGSTVMGALNAVMSANPIVLIVSLIAGLVVAFIGLWNTSEKFRDFWIGLWEKIKQAFSVVADAISNFFTVTLPNAINAVVTFFQGLPAKIQTAISNLVTIVTTVFTNVKNAIMTKAQEIYDNLPTGFQLVVQNVQTIIQNLVTIFQNIFETIKTVVQTAISVVKAIFSGDFASIPGIVSEALEKIKGFFSTILDSAVTIVVNWIAMVINYFRGWGETLVTVFNDLKAKVDTWWTNFKTTFTEKAKEIIDATVKFFKELPGKIYNAIVTTIDKIKTWGTQILSTAKTAITNLVNTVINTAKTLPDKIYNAIKNTINKIKVWGLDLIIAGKDAIQSMIDNVVETAKTLPEKFVEIGKNVIEGIKSGITGALSGLYDSIKQGLSGLVDKAKDALGIQSPSRVFANVVGKMIPAGIAKGINENADIANNAVQDMTDDLTSQAVNLNGATIERKLSTTFGSGAVNAGFDNSSILNKLDGIYERLSRLQIVLDTGTLVGETIDKIDAGLASNQLLRARGV